MPALRYLSSLASMTSFKAVSYTHLNNRFESPNLTYVLRFKTNARRGGFIRNVWMNRSVATAVGAASIHATMLYEDGRNGDYLPTFENICIENLTAHGGDYGIFLEAFPEVPIRGLTLRNIDIEGVRIPLRAMNWENPVLENVKINGVPYPRPTEARILGIPCPGGRVDVYKRQLPWLWACASRESCQTGWISCPSTSALWARGSPESCSSGCSAQTMPEKRPERAGRNRWGTGSPS